jgi:hypothetical protein
MDSAAPGTDKPSYVYQQITVDPEDDGYEPEPGPEMTMVPGVRVVRAGITRRAL